MLATEASRASSKGFRVSMTFEDQDVLRSTSIKNILHRGASIFQDSIGTEETYALSRSTKNIDVFISHNWAVPRREKFWALTLHFNLLYAAAASYAGVGLGCYLDTLPIQPTMRNRDLVMRPYCLILGSCTFFLMLLVGHDVPLLGTLLCRRRVFLDKVCIHQTDPALKAEGIKNLGGFLRHSNRMLVLFHRLYVQKLWTVYELACFMYLHRRDKLDLLPLGVARVALQCVGLSVIVQGILVCNFHFGSRYGSASNIVTIGLLAGLCCTPLTFILRAWALQRSILFQSLRSFRISEAQCADENDRPLVTFNICSFVRVMGLAPDEMGDPEALLCFDRLVQEQMPERLRSAVGRTGVPYKYAVLAGMSFGFYTIDMISSQQDAPVTLLLAWLVYGFNMQTFVIPSAFLISAWICNKCPPLPGRWPELALKVGTANLATIGMICSYYLSAFFRDKAKLDVWWLLVYAVVSAVEMPAMVKLF